MDETVQARFREYKRKKELRKNKTQPSSDQPSPDCEPSVPLTKYEKFLHHPLTPILLKLTIYLFLLLFFSHHGFGSAFFVCSIPGTFSLFLILC